MSTFSSIQELFEKIAALPEDWHQAGTLDPVVLEAIIRYCSRLKITNSIETGSGKSTLLFSHLSPNHKVFAKDGGNGSVTKVKESSLLNRASVEFIEGPTQLTLPNYHFDCSFQIALIDGPHGYPFPDIEYYYIYQRLESGSLLILDDIDIPSIHNMFDVIKADEMFTLVEVVNTAAFFIRTEAAMFDPLEDGWWLQNYNKGKLVPPLQKRSPLNVVKRCIPSPIKTWLKQLLNLQIKH